MWLLWKSTVFACDQWCIQSANSVEKKNFELNGDKHTWICPIETLVWKCWSNDYTLDQLEMQERVCKAVLNVSLSVTLITQISWHVVVKKSYVVNFHSIADVVATSGGTGKILVSGSSRNLSMLHWAGWMETFTKKDCSFETAVTSVNCGIMDTVIAEWLQNNCSAMQLNCSYTAL
jgi:hypothetical protein